MNGKVLVKGFDPIYDENSEILILGTAPGRASLEKGEYYANPGNRIWEVIEKVFGGKVASLDYQDKVKYLLEKHIALWDVCKSCYRKGSADESIDKTTGGAGAVVFNDIAGLLKKAKRIRKIVCNGQTAYDLLREYISSLPGGKLPRDVEIVYAPSTSPANNAHYAGQKLIDAWRKAL